VALISNSIWPRRAKSSWAATRSGGTDVSLGVAAHARTVGSLRFQGELRPAEHGSKLLQVGVEFAPSLRLQVGPIQTGTLTEWIRRCGDNRSESSIRSPGRVPYEACETATADQKIRIMHERMELTFVWNLVCAVTIAASGVGVGDGC
jgi:hypothetical protein